MTILIVVLRLQVIYFTDPIDEYLTQNLSEYEEKKLQNASKEDLKIGGKDDKTKLKETRQAYKELTKWWKELLGNENVESVKVIFKPFSHNGEAHFRAKLGCTFIFFCFVCGSILFMKC